VASGDPRGWRSRHHREHVDGDYRNPPDPGAYDRELLKSKRSMKRDPVFLTPEQRVVVCRTIGESLQRHSAELIDLSVGSAHFHMLARFTPCGSLPETDIPGIPDSVRKDPYELLKRAARHFVGIAKKDSARFLGDAGLALPGGLWATRGKIKAIADREHQLAVVKYIRDHAIEGAAVWSLLDEPDAGGA